ncbi:hypothetical protein AOC36_08200 [Erysipelothrix larvae]|uniref:HTH rpiR-type domain-containing protein n=1 Tax=Erysipelothrix larvae TaxID=1514105 RepID=A0A0X8H0T9_9FIRM|nr:MurR/RpiR family transcriptional regulator [Erysipelothrix larvae]AMC93967.1 hypothetical protein AOC36_08200 [Erysipelothrix larvae]
MEELLSTLQNIVNNSSHASKSDADVAIARFLIENIAPPLVDLDIETLAKECYTSQATVSRFCRKIGFESFGQMKGTYLRIEKIGSELFKDNEANLKFDSIHDSQTLSNYIELIYDALLDFDEQINFAVIENLCHSIKKAKKVYVYGAQLSGNVVSNFQYMLLCIGKNIAYFPTAQLQIDSIETIDKDTLVLVASADGNLINKRGYFMNELVETDAKKILITQNITIKRIDSFDEVVQLGNYKHPKVGRYKLQLFFEVLINKYYQLYGNIKPLS